jgi:hypothetical protein
MKNLGLIWLELGSEYTSEECAQFTLPIRAQELPADGVRFALDEGRYAAMKCSAKIFCLLSQCLP